MSGFDLYSYLFALFLFVAFTGYASYRASLEREAEAEKKAKKETSAI